MGVLLSEFSRQGYLKALNDVEIMRGEENLAERLRDVARREFDLAGVGRTRYRRLYERLLERASANGRTENLETI